MHLENEAKILKSTQQAFGDNSTGRLLAKFERTSAIGDEIKFAREAQKQPLT